jgi:glycerol transport system permease protein
MSISAFLPVMTVLNYSLHIIFAGSIPKYIGLENYKEVLSTQKFISSLGKQFIYTFEVMLIELPLGLALALILPKRGRAVGLVLVLLGIPLLIPWNIVGIIWRIFVRSDIGILPAAFARIGFHYSVEQARNAWWSIVIMDVWHWAPLVALLCFAGLQAIPQEFYQAARVDAASKFARFRYVTLPKLKHVLIIAVLIRSMDSFRVYDEPFILTAGGPGSSTELLSIYTSRQAIGAFNLGFASAISLVYFIIVLILCYVLYVAMSKVGERK